MTIKEGSGRNSRGTTVTRGEKIKLRVDWNDHNWPYAKRIFHSYSYEIILCRFRNYDDEIMIGRSVHYCTIAEAM
jgi:hypothetical protein